MSEDIEFCLHAECTNKKCERHPSQIRQTWFDHSFMDLRGHICKYWQNAEDFGWKCPYTDKHCDTFDCDTCEVNAEEERWAEELQGESRIIAEDDEWQNRIAEIRSKLWDCGVNMGEGLIYHGVWVRWRDIVDVLDKYTKADVVLWKVIEQIRAEVKALVTEGESQYDLGFNGAVFRVLQIIDKYTKGEGNEDRSD